MSEFNAREVTPKRIAALPKWARDEMYRLDANVRNLTAERDALRGEIDEPGPWSYDFRASAQEMPLPKDVHRTKVTLDKFRALEFVYFANELRVYAHGGALVMRPRATNTAYLDVDPSR